MRARLLQRPDVADLILFRVPPRLQAAAFFAQPGQLGLDARVALPRGGFLFAGQCRTLDVELHDATLDLVDLLRH